MADCLDSQTRFRSTLVRLGDLFRPGDLDRVKFVCKDVIPGSYRERIMTPEGLFEELEDRGRLNPSNLTFLRAVLQNALFGRTDVLRIIDEYEQGEPITSDGETRQLSSGLRTLCAYLEDNLAREYKSFLRRLEVNDRDIMIKEEENPRNVKEVIHQCLYVWLCANTGTSDAVLISKVIAALKREKRNDLAKHVEAKFNQL
jgi:hypothetical protein